MSKANDSSAVLRAKPEDKSITSSRDSVAIYSS